MTCAIHQNDIGKVIKIQISYCDNNAINISTATTKQILFKKPNMILWNISIVKTR